MNATGFRSPQYHPYPPGRHHILNEEARYKETDPLHCFMSRSCFPDTWLVTTASHPLNTACIAACLSLLRKPPHHQALSGGNLYASSSTGTSLACHRVMENNSIPMCPYCRGVMIRSQRGQGQCSLSSRFLG